MICTCSYHPPGLVYREDTASIHVASPLDTLLNSCSVISFAFVVLLRFLLRALLLYFLIEYLIVSPQICLAQLYVQRASFSA